MITRRHGIRTLLGSSAVFAATAFAAQVISCNVHEVGHAIVGTLLGWKVERIDFCLPAGGGVQYAHIGTWAGNAQGCAGGLAAALVLSAAYMTTSRRRRRDSATPARWAVGAGVVVWIGPQLFIAALEGSAGLGEDYTDVFVDAPGLFFPIMALAMAAGPTFHALWWRRGPTRQQGPGDQAR